MFENLRSRLQHAGLDLERKYSDITHQAMGWTNNSSAQDVRIQVAVAQEATQQGLGNIQVRRFNLIIGNQIYPNATIIRDTKNNHLSQFWSAVDATRDLTGAWLPKKELTDEEIKEAAKKGVEFGYKVK